MELVGNVHVRQYSFEKSQVKNEHRSDRHEKEGGIAFCGRANNEGLGEQFQREKTRDNDNKNDMRHSGRRCCGRPFRTGTHNNCHLHEDDRRWEIFLSLFSFLGSLRKINKISLTGFSFNLRESFKRVVGALRIEKRCELQYVYNTYRYGARKRWFGFTVPEVNDYEWTYKTRIFWIIQTKKRV